jgi:hypothetical protein
MNLDRPRNLLSSDEIDQVTNNLAGAKNTAIPDRYGSKTATFLSKDTTERSSQ